MRKKVSINKIIKKVNKDISNMCAANGFCFTSNDMIDVSMTMVAKCYANDFLNIKKVFKEL